MAENIETMGITWNGLKSSHHGGVVRVDEEECCGGRGRRKHAVFRCAVKGDINAAPFCTKSMCDDYRPAQNSNQCAIFNAAGV